MRVNEEIRAREIRIVDSQGEQLGIFTLKEGLRVAQEKNLDLVEVAPNAKPPVCRIMDYGKYRYEQSKREREAKKKQKAAELKEIRMTPKIEGHDFQVKVRSVARFLEDGDKVKATVRFRGREIVHSEIGRILLRNLADEVKELGTVEREPRVEGRNMIMILSPRQVS